MRLRTLHAVLFAAIALILTLLGSAVTLKLAGKQLRAQIGGEMATVAGQVRRVLDRSVYGGWRDIRVLSAVAHTIAPTVDSRRAWLEAVKGSFPAYAWIGFADRNGVVTASTGRVLEGASVAERPWFTKGLVAPFAGDVHKALLLERYMPASEDGGPWRFIDVSAPLLDAAGSADGVVGAHLSWAWARGLTSSVVDPHAVKSPGIEVLIVDKDGSIILGPASVQGSAMPDTAKLWRKATAGDKFAVEHWPDGVTYLVGASRTIGVNDYPGLGWTVIVRQPVALAFAPAHRLASRLFTGGLILALVAACLGVLIGRRISRPLVRLTEAADALARSPDSATTLAPSGTVEVRRLAAAFTRMGEAVAERDRRLAEANEQLERRVEDRTRELEGMRRTAEQASQAKTEFLATMSHEIRTPLNGVIGYTEILLEENGLPPEQRRSVERIRGAGNALLTIVNDILDFSKVESGEIALDLRPFALSALVDEASSIVALGAAAKGLALTVSVAPDLPGRLVGDESRLRQILLNLLNNAIKFTRHGSVSLAVTGAAGENDGCTLLFTVTDTGIGIPADKLDRLFHRFSQVDGSIGREFGGTGLGLAISRQLAELMGGTMSVESEVDRGSCFTFTVSLPRAPEIAAPSAPGAESARPERLQILLAEDVAINQEIACKLLEMAGYSVDVVADGVEAVAAVQAKAYDLVLMDVQMPRMDGLAASRAIRDLDHPCNSVIIVAMTANVLPAEITRFREAGMDDHVGKPFKRTDLTAAVERWSRGRAAAAA
ncbi:hybrid sensor histidine kinase/response regulator [Methylobacterium brachythecii]|uniref:histidine kinase n=1 Tax=Methylobacterium brachythecii TaxID=1176177 RepID=A0A7W6AF06_9HYPH|nr:hybrid sensor histidine kinase/response regulator [Methylobacterium brachythecii]MBB3902093.1 signal transduction histidine kinase/CheY-like chemotaxis protein [Methylobacterium brachythecii]GLS44490.1 hypothetical protein GCM10007884_24780 [Methylobacterium brachythecii]